IMRILHLTDGEKIYGSGRVILELSKAFKKVYSCHSVIGVINRSSNSPIEILEEARANGLAVVNFSNPGKLNFKLLYLIKKFISDNNITLLHCHGYKSNFYGLIAAKKKIPIVTTNHNWLKSHWKLKFYCFIDALLIRYFDRIVAVSGEIKEDMVRYRIPEKKISVIDNGIDLDRFKKPVSDTDIKEEFGLKDEVIVGTIGSLGVEKGHIFLLMAARKVVDKNKNVKFLIVGEGYLRNQLEAKALSLGIRDNVIFAGYRCDIPELISAMDIFVLPSIKEGLPMVILEAMAANKPVIASNIGAVPKIIKHHESGILIEPGNINDLSNAIIEIIAESNKMLKMSQAGNIRIKEKFSSEIMAERYMNLYKDLTDNYPTSSVYIRKNS
ncbi:MAG: glycosyltransferase family 4 protein, partial [Deltaproteobacteria bacterium]|nr:glycosyltransferase family 4 protein [Deltaproteobacteria bacterium]